MATQQGVDKAARPVALAVEPDGIPGELKALKRWVLWRYEWNAQKGKWEKPPVSPATGHKASWLKPGKWAPFELALEACGAGKGKADGLGLVLSAGPDDPLDLAVIDLDAAGLEDALRPLGTYCEASPTTGKGGCHAWVRGGVPLGVKNVVGRAEVYTERQYICVTGRRLGHSGAEVARPHPDTLAAVLRSLGVLGDTPARGPAPPPPVEAREAVEAKPSPEDDGLLVVAMSASNGAAFRRLWGGDTGGYVSPSDADLALCNLLAFYWQKDAASVDRMFRLSGLMRPKWDEPHYSGGETYGQHTVNIAVRDCRTTYAGRRRTANGEAVCPKASTASLASTGGGGAGPGAPAIPRPSANGHAGGAPVLGRLASEVTEEALEWFLEPWVARCMLTLVAGKPSAGKSTFLAHLATRARRVVYLPGPEEYVPAMTLRRLRAAGVSLAGVRLLDDRRYSLVDDAQALCRQIRADGADLLLIDPVDSFFPPAWSENDGAQVREVLESVEKIARESRCAAVGVRHPGKSAENVMRGSQAWGAVPRAVLHLVCDDGPPVRRLMHARKWGFPGTPPADRFFDIVGPEGAPGVWREAGAAGRGLSELLTVEADPVTRTQVELACEFIKRMLAEGEAEVAWMLALGRNQGYPEATMQRAKRLLGVTTRHDGHGRNSAHWWVPPEKWPD